MIQVQPFSTSVMSSHKVFFILNELPKHTQEIGVWIKTPTGIDPVDFVNVFSLHDGTLVAAWVEPFKHLPLHNVVAYTNGKTQIINMLPLERIIDIYDKPVDSDFGTFSFGASIPIPSGDWRCYRGMYGFWQFSNDNHVDEIVNDVSEILVYESILNVGGTGHLVYVEATNKDKVAYQKINNSIAPASGRTLQETLRLAYEWSVMAEEPFNSQENIALSAKSFLDALNLTDEERTTLENILPMQIYNYISGSETARVRPSDISELNDEVKNIVFKRMASLSLSALLKIHNIEDTYGVLELEKTGLEEGIQRFKDHYQIPSDWLISETDRIIEHCDVYYPAKVDAFVHNQLRHFSNKQLILDKVTNNAL